MIRLKLKKIHINYIKIKKKNILEYLNDKILNNAKIKTQDDFLE
jgi:hypothetical protein